ncbi:MAG TPA: MarR family transcriptional regulator [Streptosporangiaceae bacterium]|jgi:DNA-binding MarR family transcriptional regulator
MTVPAKPGPEPERSRRGSAGNSGREPPVPGRDQLLDALNWQSRRSSVLFGLLNRSVAARIGLNPTDVEALGVLSVLGVTTPTRLAGLLAMGTGAVTQVIDRLEQAGFARRVREAKDRRSVSIELVPEKARQAGAFYAALRQDAAELTGRYDDRDLALIVDYLTRANDILGDAGSAVAAAGAPSRRSSGLRAADD